jgi:phosphoglycerate kinase
MAAFRTLDELEADGKRVVVRVDFNVPMSDGRVTDATRIERAATTIRELKDKGAKVVLLSHFGRPKGRREPSMSLEPIAPALGEVMGSEVRFVSDCIGPEAEQASRGLAPGGVLLLENLRFHEGEEKNEAGFADQLARLGDVYVNDAFSSSHRAHASVVGIAERLPAYAGRLMQAEIEALEKAVGGADRPAAALIGGAKVSTKLEVLGHLLDRVDALIIGGGMANTFMHAEGLEVGKSLCERELAAQAKAIIAQAAEKNVDLILPIDAVVAPRLDANAPVREVDIEQVGPEDMILDVGHKTIEDITAKLGKCKTLLWNGPLGAFEVPPFDKATVAVARTAASLTGAGKLLSVAGGGDTLAALAHAEVLDQFSYVSSAGGAFLEWLEGKSLPGLEALKPR